MKLFVQIPCFNEAETIAQTIADIPRKIKGISSVEVVVIDDGSTDDTTKIAKKAGADHIVRHNVNRGLAITFKKGLEFCLEHGADIIVNTDGDGQYQGKYIKDLVTPILDGESDVVIGNRQVHTMDSYSRFHKISHKLGAPVINALLHLRVDDPISGFRAIHRRVAEQLNIHSSFSYTTEMLIQLAYLNVHIVNVPVETNDTSRPSRLYKRPSSFIFFTGMTLSKAYAMYYPLRTWLPLGIVMLLVGFAPILRFLIEYSAGDGVGHIQSLILGAMAMIMGTFVVLFGLLIDFQLRQQRKGLR